MSLIFSIVTSNTDMRPRAIEADWAYLATILNKPEPRGRLPLDKYLRADKSTRDTQKNGAGWIPGRFKREGRRCDADIETLSVFVGDVDNKQGTQPVSREELRRALNGYTYLAHTSYSHSPECDKWRFVVLLKRPVSKEEWPAVFAYFDTKLGGALDPKGKTPSQMYYLPSCPPDAVGLFEEFSANGEPFDPDALPAVSPGNEPQKIELVSELPQRFLDALSRDKHLRGRWKGDSKGLKDGSRSGMDFALASMLVRRHFFDDEIAAVLRRYPHGKAVESGDKYLAGMLTKLRAEQPKTTEQRIETLTAAELQKLDLPEPRFVVPGLIAEGVNVLAGRPKTNKSWLTLALGIATASGGRALGKIAVPAGDALILALEDSKRRLQDRMRLILGDSAPWPERLTLVPSGGWPRMDAGGLEKLDEWLGAHPEARLVVVDTLARFRPPRQRNENVYEGDYAAVGAIQTTALRRRVGVVIVHHQRKSEAEDFVDTVSGSLGIAGAADAILVLARARGQCDAVLAVTGRDIEERELALRWEKTAMVWTLLGDADDYKKSESKAAILKVLTDTPSPMGPKAIAAALGKSSNTVSVILHQLLKSGDVEAVGRGLYKATEF